MIKDEVIELVEEVVAIPCKEILKISLHALTGSQNPKNVRVMGKVGLNG